MRHPNIMVLILLFLLIGCGDNPRLQETYPQTPLYPNAQALTLDKSHEAVRHVSFDTVDSLETVLAYYDQELTRTGWGRSKDDFSKSGILRSYLYRAKVGADVYSFSFYISAPPSTKQTRINVTLLYNGPGYQFPYDFPFPPGFN